MTKRPRFMVLASNYTLLSLSEHQWKRQCLVGRFQLAALHAGWAAESLDRNRQVRSLTTALRHLEGVLSLLGDRRLRNSCHVLTVGIRNCLAECGCAADDLPTRHEREFLVSLRKRIDEVWRNAETEGYVDPATRDCPPAASQAARQQAGTKANTSQTNDSQETLLRELQHRNRNLLTVVMSLLEGTRRETASVDEFHTLLRERIEALTRVQRTLARAGHEGLNLQEVIRDELMAHGLWDGTGTHVCITGPDVLLEPVMTQVIALAIHELSTNAVKHGTAVNEAGFLSVNWAVEEQRDTPQRLLRLIWNERGTPLRGVRPGNGFGRELIERALPYQFGAKTSYEISDSGVRCMVAVPIR